MISELKPGERLDDLERNGLMLIQHPGRFCYGVDAVLLSWFAKASEGERVLDLCAAPGGKATELGAKLNGSGVLIANDLSNSRARGLLKNIELFGIGNVLVLSEEPGKLVNYFPEYFDKILIDAPCSGEGMFRKDRKMVKAWEEHGPEFFVKIQRSIITQAAQMLKPGGMLLYSTCTFSPEEDEGSIAWFLQEHPDFHLVEVDDDKDLCGCHCIDHGHPEWADGNLELEKTVRIWPHLADGEGHFLALLVKGENGWDPVPEEIGSLCEKTGAECAETVADELVVSGKRKKSAKSGIR